MEGTHVHEKSYWMEIGAPVMVENVQSDQLGKGLNMHGLQFRLVSRADCDPFDYARKSLCPHEKK